MAKIISTLTGNKKMKKVNDLIEYFEKVGEKGNPQEAYDILGKPEISLEEWVKNQKQITE